MDNQQQKVATVYEARFNSEEVMAVAGISDMTLQNWLARGRLNLKQQNPGRGKPRQYTVYEVARIRFIKKLVDLAFPLAPAFKITAALERLWEATPGGHEAYAHEPNLASWLLVVEAQVWNTRRRSARFPLSHSAVPADGYFAIWATEIIGSPRGASIRDAVNFFVDSAVIVVNMGVLLHQTVLLLERCLAERDG
jgi:DNA-binding transcriptional MerR regulator